MRSRQSARHRVIRGVESSTRIVASSFDLIRIAGVTYDHDAVSDDDQCPPAQREPTPEPLRRLLDGLRSPGGRNPLGLPAAGIRHWHWCTTGHGRSALPEGSSNCKSGSDQEIHGGFVPTNQRIPSYLCPHLRLQ